jgi:hypothetical protein
MAREDDIQIGKEELALAAKGEALIVAALAEVQAPQSLREGIERERARAQAQPRVPFWRRRGALAAIAGATALAAIAVVALQSVSSGSPSLNKVEAVARLGATEPAPATRGGDPPVLAAQVSPISFPDWKKSFGWEAVGRRDSSVAGRDVVTVYYRNPDGAKLGYAIVAGAPVGGQLPGHRVRREGNTYNVTPAGEHTVVTWTQQGHTCMIVASATVPTAKLVELAASRNV